MVSAPAGSRLLRAYLVVGLAFSLVVGIVVVVVLHGYTATPVTTFWRAVVEVALGAAACGYAVGVGTRRRSATPEKPSRTTAWLRKHLDDMTTTRAGLIGVVTHLPGLVYLAALNAIGDRRREPAGRCRAGRRLQRHLVQRRDRRPSRLGVPADRGEGARRDHRRDHPPL